jgi:hypothetical protein
MFDWLNKKFRPVREYPTWDHVPVWNKVNDDMEKVAGDMNKVLPFPDLKVAPLQTKEEPVGKTMYSIGLTDNNCVSLHIGYSSIIMNSVGVQQLIDQLVLFHSQIEQAQESTN